MEPVFRYIDWLRAITLLGRPGEFVRPYLIAAKEKVPASSQMAALVLERIYDVLIVLAIFGFALGRVRRSDVTLGPALSWVFATGGWFVGGLSVLILGLLAVFRHFSDSMQHRLLNALRRLPERHLQRVSRLVTAFVEGMASTRSARAMLLLVWYTIVEWGIIAATVFCVMRAFGGSAVVWLAGCADFSWISGLRCGRTDSRAWGAARRWFRCWC